MKYHRPAAFYHNILLAAALVSIQETQCALSALKMDTTNRGKTDLIHKWFDDLWSMNGAVRVEQQHFMAYHPELSEQWVPIRKTNHDIHKDDLKVPHCEVVGVPRESVEAVTLKGRLLTLMLIERLVEKNSSDHADSSSGSLVNEMTERQKDPSKPIGCQPNIQYFTFGKWNLQQTEVVVDQLEHAQQVHSHFMIALPLQDFGIAPNSVWMIINKQVISPQTQPTETTAFIDQLPRDGVPVSRWFVASYYLTVQEDGDDPQEPFCKGMSMVMFMDGFQRSLTNQPRSCLNYFFPSWKLLDVGQLKGAMVYSFLLALLTEGLCAIRAVVLQHVKLGRTRKMLLILLYILQQTMGYVIMLVAMMYSVELFLSVVLGLAVGNRLFVRGGDAVKHLSPSLTPAAALRNRTDQDVVYEN